MVMLMHASNLKKKDNYAFLVEEVLGKTAGFILHIVFIILCFGFVVLYLIVTSQFMPKILTGFGMDHDLANSNNVRIIVIAAVVVILLPMALQRDLSSLAHFSAFGIFAIVYVVLLIIAQTPMYMQQNFSMDKVKWAV